MGRANAAIGRFLRGRGNAIVILRASAALNEGGSLSLDGVAWAARTRAYLLSDNWHLGKVELVLTAPDDQSLATAIDGNWPQPMPLMELAAPEPFSPLAQAMRRYRDRPLREARERDNSRLLDEWSVTAKGPIGSWLEMVGAVEATAVLVIHGSLLACELARRLADDLSPKIDLRAALDHVLVPAWGLYLHNPVALSEGVHLSNDDIVLRPL